MLCPDPPGDRRDKDGVGGVERLLREGRQRARLCNTPPSRDRTGSGYVSRWLALSKHSLARVLLAPKATAHRRSLCVGDGVRLNIAGPLPALLLDDKGATKDSGILRTWPGTIRNVNVHASVSRGGTIRRGDPVGRCAEAQASTNRATEAVKPCRKFFPPCWAPKLGWGAK